MEVKIGIAESARELVVSSGQTPDEVQALVDAAFDKGSTLVLTDDKGRRYVVKAASVSYVEIGPEDGRRVGFTIG
ncbi:DUF3107 domain-containing protein [Pseudonocardia sp. GCM10023141]|uniref:DUF3107 domain-containing protein n=1 Tax=Pseudonocardia sp. GCM10023141 TaxID=3252653 RepID=UPI003622B8DA